MQGNVLKYTLDKIQEVIEAGKTELLLTDSYSRSNSALNLQITKVDPNWNIFLISGFAMPKSIPSPATQTWGRCGKISLGRGIPRFFYCAGEKVFVPDQMQHRCTVQSLSKMVTSWLTLSRTECLSLSEESMSLLKSCTALQDEMLNRLDDSYCLYRQSYTSFSIMDKSVYLSHAELMNSIREFMKIFHFSCIDTALLRRYVLLSVMSADTSGIRKSDEENLSAISNALNRLTEQLCESFIYRQPLLIDENQHCTPDVVPLGFTAIEMCKFIEDPSYLDCFNRDVLEWTGFMYTADICSLIMQEVFSGDEEALYTALYPSGLSHDSLRAAIAYRQMVRGINDNIDTDAQSVRLARIDRAKEADVDDLYSVCIYDLFKGIMDAVSGHEVSTRFLSGQKNFLHGIRFDEVALLKYRKSVLYEAQNANQSPNQ